MQRVLRVLSWSLCEVRRWNQHCNFVVFIFAFLHFLYLLCENKSVCSYLQLWIFWPKFFPLNKTFYLFYFCTMHFSYFIIFKSWVVALARDYFGTWSTDAPTSQRLWRVPILDWVYTIFDIDKKTKLCHCLFSDLWGSKGKLESAHHIGWLVDAIWNMFTPVPDEDISTKRKMGM